MTTNSKIEWTEMTWNPTTGCTKISPGCKHCYAETMAKRLQAMGTPGYENGFKLSLMYDRINQPLKRKKPTIFFVNSMSDLFHKDIPYGFLDRVFEVISKTPHHTYQVLTKRPENMRTYFNSRNVPKNAWLGVSVENRKHGCLRIDILRDINATIRFISAEPLLEDLGVLNLSGIHWIIVGGESGPKARPMEREWAMSIHRQAKNYGVAYFFKQWGSWGSDGIKRNKHANGRLLNGIAYDNYPDSTIAF